MTWEKLPITKIEEVIGYEFKDKDLLKQAFTTVRYWYNKTTYNHDLLPYVGNGIIIDEVFDLVKVNELTQEKAVLIKNCMSQFWLSLIKKLHFDEYLIYAPNEKLTNYQLVAEIISIFPLLVCAVYFDENKEVTNNVKKVIQKLLGTIIWKDKTC